MSKHDIKQFDGEAPVMLELWGMRSTASSYLPIPPFGKDMTQGQFLSGV